MAFYFLIISLILIINTPLFSNTLVSISCPTLQCDADIGENICFIHSGSSPVTYIRLAECSKNEICDIGSMSDYAWINSPYQQYSSGMSYSLS